MAATVAVHYWNGGSDGSPTSSADTSLRFRTDDSPGLRDATNPCVVPSSGTQSSYWMHVALDITGAFTQIDNIRHYTDGAIAWTLGTDGKVLRGDRDAGDKGVAAASYVKAGGTAGTAGSYIKADHTFYSGQTTKAKDITADTSGSAPVIDSSTIVAAGSSKAIVLQAVIDDDATQGAQAAETFTWMYDEI